MSGEATKTVAPGWIIGPDFTGAVSDGGLSASYYYYRKKSRKGASK